MNYCIEIQKSLSPSEYWIATFFADSFVLNTREKMDNFPHKGSGGRRSYLRRGTLGYMIPGMSGVVFRRISKNKRKFGIVKIETMVQKNGEEIDLKQCSCPRHLGGTKVKWRDKKPDTIVHRVED